MTSMISVDGTPVAFIGATRWHATSALEQLTEPQERLAIVELCEAMTSEHSARLTTAPRPSRPGQTRCTVYNCDTTVTPSASPPDVDDPAPPASERLH